MTNLFLSCCLFQKFENNEAIAMEGSWFLWFRAEHELGKFERAVAECWRELFQVGTCSCFQIPPCFILCSVFSSFSCFLKKLSVLMLCAPVFIFISGSLSWAPTIIEDWLGLGADGKPTAFRKNENQSVPLFSRYPYYRRGQSDFRIP